MKRHATTTLALVALVAGALTAGPASARPSYFEQLKSRYSIADDTNLDACGVCHYRWTGTGQRNPFGQAVEQRLYVGLTVEQSLEAVENLDSDSDGFLNVDELVTWMTLPGYNCTNFIDAVGAPLGYDTYITPMVDSCLDPLDIRLDRDAISGFAVVQESEQFVVTVINNGSEDILTISDYGFATGDASLSVDGPVAPFDIPVGGTEELTITFAPTVSGLLTDTLEIDSNDPDEATVTVSISMTGIPDLSASPSVQAACYRQISKSALKYSKKHLASWVGCYQDEINGVACNSGARDVATGSEVVRLEAAIGGDKDTSCKGAGLFPTNLRFYSTCGGSCDYLSVDTIADIATCYECRQDEGMLATLAAALGTSPPDLPPNTLSGEAAKCQKRISKAVEKGIGKLAKTLAQCELESVINDDDTDCTAANAEAIAKLKSKTDSVVDKCKDTTGLIGCRFEDMPVATCLGDAVESIATDLVDAMFGNE